ncbi:hypothetical protein ABZ344_34410, partial [Streptomyces olivaceus]
MADAKVIPFDDDRSRGNGASGAGSGENGGSAPPRPSRRRGGAARRKGAAVHEQMHVHARCCRGYSFCGDSLSGRL